AIGTARWFDATRWCAIANVQLARRERAMAVAETLRTTRAAPGGEVARALALALVADNLRYIGESALADRLLDEEDPAEGDDAGRAGSRSARRATSRRTATSGWRAGRAPSSQRSCSAWATWSVR